MPFDRPTLAVLYERVAQDIAAELGLGPLLPRSVELVLARILAHASHGQHAHIEWSVRQLFPDTAEELYLERWAAVWGVNRTPAELADGTVTAQGLNGSVIAAGIELRSPTGLRFAVVSEVTIVGASATVPVVALVAGAESNLPGGVKLSWVSPPTGLQPQTTVQAPGLQGGVDLEDDESLRQRLLRRIQQPPQGGSKSDYEAWALEVSGVGKAWVFPQQFGEGTVGVAVAAAGLDPIPTAGLVEDVQELLDERRPVTAQVTAWAPEALDVDLTIALTPDTLAVRDAVENSLTDLLLREGAPGGVISRAQLESAIATSPSWQSHVLLSPAGDVLIGPNQLPVLGVITWA